MGKSINVRTPCLCHVRYPAIEREVLYLWVSDELKNLNLILHLSLDELYHKFFEPHFQATQIE